MTKDSIQGAKTLKYINYKCIKAFLKRLKCQKYDIHLQGITNFGFFNINVFLLIWNMDIGIFSHRFGRLFVLSLYKEDSLQILNVCPFDYMAVVVSGKVGHP